MDFFVLAQKGLGVIETMCMTPKWCGGQKAAKTLPMKAHLANTISKKSRRNHLPLLPSPPTPPKENSGRLKTLCILKFY